MDPFTLAAVALTLAAAFAYLNAKTLRLPTTIGVMAFSLVFSLILLGVDRAFPAVGQFAEQLVSQFEFNRTVLQGLLGFLLFAGALHVKAADLSRQRALIATLAVFGTAVSTVLVGLAAWGVAVALGRHVPPALCFLFGALIAPTDPVAVLGMLRRVAAPPGLTAKIAGESLFNDGVGVVFFLALLEVAVGGHGPEPTRLATLFLVEGLGGAAFGLAVGFVAFLLFRSIDDYHVEVLLSLAVASGGYAAAAALHVSGPIAMVVIGLLIGNRGRLLAMSERTVARLDDFWELIDETLNAILFVLIGLEVLVLEFTAHSMLAGLLLYPATLAARWISVVLPVSLFRRRTAIPPNTARILTWGGLRGGISVALALSIPSRLSDGTPVSGRDAVVAATYVVVVASVLIQGLTFGTVVKRLVPCGHGEHPHLEKIPPSPNQEVRSG